MKDQALTVRVGELATAVGYPLPSIRWVENAKLWVVLEPQGVAAPVLQLDRRVSQWCTALFDIVVAESLQRAAFGMRRHQRIFKIASYSAAAVLGAAGAMLAGYAGTASALLLYVVVVTLASATYARWLYRRIDARLREILGAGALREGLEHMDRPLSALNRLRWLWAGAGVLPGERLRWLNASVAD